MSKLKNFLLLNSYADTLRENNIIAMQRFRFFKITTLFVIVVYAAVLFQSYIVFSINSPLMLLVSILFISLFANYFALAIHKKAEVAYIFLLVILFALLHIVTYYSGGVRNSGIFYLSSLILVAFILLNSKGGKTIAVFSVLHIVYFYFVNRYTGWVDYSLIGSELHLIDLDFLLTGVISVIMLTALSGYIEKSKNKVIQDIASKSNELEVKNTELEEMNKERTLLFESIGEIFFSVDMIQYKLFAISSACEKIYGYPKKNFFKNNNLWLEVIHPDDKHIIAENDGDMRAGKNIFLQYRIFHPDNEIRWVESKIKPTLDEKGQLVRIDGVTSDITERKIAEKKLQEKINELHTFIYKTSHDLRAPLCSTLGLLNFLKNETTDSDILNYVEMIDKSNSRMLAILDNLTEVAKITHGTMKKDKIDFRQLVNHLVESVKNMAGSDGISYKVNVTANGHFRSDTDLLNSILQNLVVNSIKYRKNKPDSVVAINVSENKKEIQIEIEDNGVGIPAKLQPKVFEMFYRASCESQGSGLGLYIVKNAVEKLGGKIELESEEKKGTKIKISLPFNN